MKFVSRGFNGCSLLEFVYFEGTEEEWDSLEFQDLKLNSATKYFYSEVEPEGDGNFWHYGENGEVVEWGKDIVL